VARISNEQLHQELIELKEIVANLQQGIHSVLPPVQELDVNLVARDVARGGKDQLKSWNQRKKAEFGRKDSHG